jgi:osmotically-inducible protein OsmY
MRHLLFKALAFALVVTAPAVPLAAQTAKTTPAHKSEIRAKQTPAAHAPRGDEAIKDRIEHRLATDASVKKYDLSVNVSNGVASLNGTVSTDAQKAEADRLARVPGVTKVNNEVKVDKDVDRTLTERTKSGLSKTGEAITDSWVTAKVKWFFVGEDALKGSDINVDTNNHVVTLKGTVRSAAGKARAVQLAKETDGVTRVEDQLTIRAKTAKTTH